MCLFDCVLFQSVVTSSIYEGVGLSVQENGSDFRPNRQNPAKLGFPWSQVGPSDFSPKYFCNRGSYYGRPTLIPDGPT